MKDHPSLYTTLATTCLQQLTRQRQVRASSFMDFPSPCSFHGFFLFIFALTLTISLSSAVLAPNMSSCNLPSFLPAGLPPFYCCAPFANYTPRLFKPNPSSSSSPRRVRRPAHTVDEVYAEKLARAYALMKALPEDDPRSFMQQANVHCAYCDKTYNQMNSSELFEVHGNWLFFPFHRWYLYFHERILAKLLGDDGFALSFWNYDHPDGASIPWLFSTYNATLVDPLRDSLHKDALAPAAIDYTWDTDARSRETQLRENANAMYRAMIRDATTPERFFGEGYRAGERPPCVYGTVEARPHNSVHFWTGKKSEVGWEDMGSLYAAARDPLFYAHHASIDRLWDVWRTLPNHYDLDDVDYLDAEFAFYNEDAELVRVKVRDALNTSNLCYVYEEVENTWMKAVPIRRSVGEAKLMENDNVCIEGQPILAPCSLVMERDLVQVEKEIGEYMELSIEYEPNKLGHLDIYINLPSAHASTDSGCEEYFDFVKMAPEYLTANVSTDVKRTYSYRSPKMNERIGALNLLEATSLIVTVVPRVLNTSIAPLSILSSSLVYSSSSQLKKAIL